jgi:hypothetical protein
MVICEAEAYLKNKIDNLGTKDIKEIWEAF